MTCQRNLDSWCGRIWAIAKGVGETQAAVAAGVSPARLRQLANPNRNDADVIETLFRLDRAAVDAGLGAPLFDLWRSRMVDAGSLRESQSERRRRLIEAAAKAAVKALLVVVQALEATLNPPTPQLQRAQA